MRSTSTAPRSSSVLCKPASRGILVPGVTVESSRRALRACRRVSGPLRSHWHSSNRPRRAGWTTLSRLSAALAESPRVVAIGEIGLDYYWVTDSEKQAQQREALQAQLMLAQDLHIPVVIHAREKDDAVHGPCADDLISILEQWVQPSSPSPGVLHSFSGSLETAQQALRLGFYIGVTGPVTYKNAAYRREVIAAIPLDRLLIETDSPYLAPHPYRGKRNEPAYVTHIADKIAAIQSRTPQEVVAVTGTNAARLFSWGEAD